MNNERLDLIEAKLDYLIQLFEEQLFKDEFGDLLFEEC